MQLPEQFTNNMKRLLGENEFNLFKNSLAENPPASVRYNPKKWKGEKTGEPVAWCSGGYYLDQRPTFTFDPLFHAGAYYAQEASSMFLDHILRKYITRPSIALDLCAAPGGKSTLALSALPEGSLLIANEAIRQRAQILAENITKWGNSATIVTNNFAEDFSGTGILFDIIIADVPCSGEGMFRKDEQAIREWSEENVETCRKRQRDIVSNIWGNLRPGGLLIYSTCTFNPQENEENVRWIAKEFGAEILPCEPHPDWNITGCMTNEPDMPVCHFLPHKTKGEGFFAAILRKSDEDEHVASGNWTKRKKAHDTKSAKQTVAPKEIKSWLNTPERYSIVATPERITAFPAEHSGILAAAEGHLNILHSGITMAIIKGKNIIPHHSLAMSTALNAANFAQAELTYEQAISFLRAESIVLPDHVQRGHVLLTYKGLPLGFAKNLGNRANNLYPQEWRIRSGHSPENVILLQKK